MVEEYTSIMKNGHVWDIVPILDRRSFVTYSSIYKVMHVVDDYNDRFKGRFLDRRFS
jgi:hypothetical protein